MGYLTPSVAPDTVVCRALFVPNDEAYLAIMRGLLQELTLPSSWTKFGTLTPIQAAQACEDMFNRFCLEKDTCRMIGEFVAYGGDLSPKPEWLVCDGSEALIADYPDLYAVIGNKFGAASADHFRLPDLRDRSLAGGSATHAIGESYGAATHAITIDELPVHNHTDSGHYHTTGNSATGVAVTPGELPVLVPNPIPAITGTSSANIGNTGGGQAMSLNPPRVSVTYLIVAKDG